MLLLREDDVEDSVGAAAGLVHVGCSHSAGKKEVIQPLLYFCLRNIALLTDINKCQLTELCSQSPSGPGCHYKR